MGRPLDIAGQRFGRLVALDEAERSGNGKRLWSCKCDCGNTVAVSTESLRSGNTKSCGCIKKELLVARNRAAATHDMTDSPEWNSWCSMKARCLNKNSKSYEDYGGRGIKVCDRWLDFINFYNDMGERPSGTSLDRIDVNGDYEPSNCRWATPTEQASNMRNNRLIEFDGQARTISGWSRETGIPLSTLRRRLKACGAL